MFIAFMLLIIVALIGTYLRAFAYLPSTGLTYKYLLHAHSHAGLLGWAYTAAMACLLYVFRPETLQWSVYKIMFVLTQVANAGMLITFSIQGYGPFSIAFSTLHILLSYWLMIRFYKDIIFNNQFRSAFPLALKFVATAFIFNFISSFGPWGLAVIASQGLKGSDIYFQAIYFYLHFQYNGWLSFVLFGLWTGYMEYRQVLTAGKNTQNAFLLLVTGTALTLFLSFLGFEIPSYLRLAGMAGGFMQLAGFLLLCKSIHTIPENPFRMNLYTRIALVILGIKIFLQLISAFPVLDKFTYASQDAIIGFLHLVLLGFITTGLLGIAAKLRGLTFSHLLSKGGMTIFLGGFLLNEISLFYNSLFQLGYTDMMPYSNDLLIIASTLMLTGLLLTGIRQLKPRLNQ